MFPSSQTILADAGSRLLQVDRILIIRLGALGDVVRTLPAVVGLRRRFPGAHLTWLVEPGAAGVVDSASVVDETMIFPREVLMEFLRAADGLSLARGVSRFVRSLRARRFDLVLDFHGILKSGVLARLSGAPVRVGYDRWNAREFSELFSNRHATLPAARVSRYERNESLVRAVVADANFPEKAFLRPSSLAVARLTARLAVSGRQGERSFILIHPGTSEGAAYKRYPPNAWATVVKQLAEEGSRVWIAAGSSSSERALVEEILRLAKGALVVAPLTRGFDDLLALLARAAVFVSCDSGPLHAASLAGIPVVQLLGPTDPTHNEPWCHSRSERAHVPVSCSPCRRGCADPVCMRDIPPSLVVSRVRRLLSGTASKDPVRTGSPR